MSGSNLAAEIRAHVNRLSATEREQLTSVVGFGTFNIATRKARTGVNPKTGEEIQIKSSKTVKFVPGKAFKELL